MIRSLADIHMNKAERAGLSKRLLAYLHNSELLAEPIETIGREAWRFRILTLAGSLQVGFCSESGWLYCRFDDPQAAVSRLNRMDLFAHRLNPHSGKWNFTFVRGVTAQTAFSAFTHELSQFL